MIGLDTNVLARYYVSANDARTQAQCLAAQRLIDSGQPLRVAKTVILELEWLLRGYYEFSVAQVRRVISHLLGLPHVDIEDRSTIELALTTTQAGIASADALHHASYRSCEAMASFDDKKFARKVKGLALSPLVKIPN